MVSRQAHVDETTSCSANELRRRLEEAEAGVRAAEERLARELAEHQTADAELQYRVAFENLLTTLSTEFISLKPDEIDQGIERALRRIAEFTDDDRSWVVLYYEGTLMENTHEWCAEGVPSCKPVLCRVPLSTSPWCNERLLRGEVVHIPRTEDLGTEASVDRSLFDSVGTQSTIMVPMIYRGTTIGSLGFDSVRRRRVRSDQTIVLLRAVGEMFVNALERKWVEEELQESQQALATLMGNLPGMAFRLSGDQDGFFEFVSEGCLDLTGYASSDLVQSPSHRYISLVHPADRASLRRAVRRAIKSQSEYHSTHRIVTAEGEVRWVLENGRGVMYPRRDTPVLEGFVIDATDRVLAYQRLEDRVQQRTREIERRRAVAEGLRVVLEALNENRPLPEVLDHVVDQASRLLSAPAVAVYRLDAASRTLTIEAARGLRTAGVLGTGHVVRRRTAARICTERQLFAIDEIAHGPVEDELVGELRSIHRKYLVGPCRALLFVPLVLAEGVYGALVHGYFVPREFTREDIDLASMLADQATLAIGNAQLRLQAEENAAAQERSRIAGDLHDSVTQLLFSANLTADALPSVLTADPVEGQRRLDQLRDLTSRALAEMRALLLELRPAAIEESGLDQALHSLVRASSGRGGLPIHLNVEGDLQMPHDVQVGLYRIVQEALNNVIRHAAAGSADVTLHGGRRGVSVRVSDDGRGFDLDLVTADHLGLTIMRERAEAIGASLSVEGVPGAGTVVRAIWPRQTKGRTS